MGTTGRPQGSRSRTRLVGAGVLTALALSVVAGCSDGGGADAAGGGEGATWDSASVAREAPSGAGAGGGRAVADNGAVPGALTQVTVSTRSVIRKGSVWLVARDLRRARAEVDDLLARHGGFLATEETFNSRSGVPRRSTLVLRVPEPAFESVMSELGEIGRTEQAERTSKDVTTEVIDVDTRVATQEASLARLRRLLREATDVEDLIRLESEIATRQAALESLKAQQAYLADQTTLSTVTVEMRAVGTVAPPPGDDDGFLAGLASGWTALKAVLVTVATVLGALVPFTVAAALVGVPLVLLARSLLRRRRERTPSPSVAPEAG